jgi:NAD(P)-dependent dehydrogenase (short-subunit alcohol dehydrogenase family)
VRRAGRTIVCDVTDRASVAQLARSVARDEGACHVLVNNAGIGARIPFDGPEALAALDRVMAVNFFGAANMTAELLALLELSAPSAIVNVSSVAGRVGLPAAPMYCASKFALGGFSEALRSSLHERGIHVATVEPGPVVTPGWAHERLARSPLRRLLVADVDAVGRAVVRAAERRRGAPVRVVPRVYRGALAVRGAAPWAARAVLREAARRINLATLEDAETVERLEQRRGSGEGGT